jgi:hypothetical protein
MKKFTATANGGAPIHSDDRRTIFNEEFWDVIEGLFSPYLTDTQGIIVSGCVISGGGPYDISEGIVFLDGEFMRLPAQTGQTLPKYIKAATAVNDSRTFADGSTGTMAVTKSAELAGSAPGTQYIAITSITDPDDRRWINYDTGWVSVSSFTTGITGSNVAYRRVGKKVQLRGTITINQATWVLGGGWFTLPAGTRPTIQVSFGNAQVNDASTIVAVTSEVRTTGLVTGGTVSGSFTNGDVYLGGMSFFID